MLWVLIFEAFTVKSEIACRGLKAQTNCDLLCTPVFITYECLVEDNVEHKKLCPVHFNSPSEYLLTMDGSQGGGALALMLFMKKNIR